MADAPAPPAPSAPPPDKIEPLPSTVFISEKRGGAGQKRG
jgi:hypothetical protein